MSELVVRRLLIDLESPIPRHWCNGDAFQTALYNALSMSFPEGEQFFIDAVRAGQKLLPPEQQQRFAAEVQGFIGQEATHRRIHALFNGHLERQGLDNKIGPNIPVRNQILAGADVRHALGITAAIEHFTAILAEWMLSNSQRFDGCEPRLKTMWLWHSAEESEHRSTAFDLYAALGGNHEWRITWFNRITYVFLSDVLRQTVHNLKRDGTLWRWSTWRSAARYLFGKHGMVREVFPAWRAYKRKDFHPSQQESELSRQWLATNTAAFTPVKREPVAA
jgi:predicted metal-dependent hydrolase